MNLTIKTLQGAKFQVAAEPADTVLSVKEKCAQTKESEAELIKLIHSGKVLKDDQTIEGANIQEKDFLVIMISKKKKAAAAPAAAPTPAPVSVQGGAEERSDEDV